MYYPKQTFVYSNINNSFFFVFVQVQLNDMKDTMVLGICRLQESNVVRNNRKTIEKVENSEITL